MAPTNPAFPVANSSQSSPSMVSEPPDIRNWFSSYTYQSPVLDTNELFGDSWGVDEEERVLYVEDSENEQEESCEDSTRVRKSHQSGICDQTTRPIIRKLIEGNRDHDHCLSPFEVKLRAPRFPQILASGRVMPGGRLLLSRFRGYCIVVNIVPAYADPLSLPSEPPDIRNWFSSYVYESPTLDSADFDISLLSNNNFGNIQVSDKAEEKSSKEREVEDAIHLCKETSLDGYTKTTSGRFVGVDDTKNHSAKGKADPERGDLYADENLCLNRASDWGTQGVPKSSIIILDKFIEPPSVKAEGPSPILHDEQQTSRVNHSTPPAHAPSRRKNTEKGEIKAEQKPIVSENDSGWILPNPKSKEPCYKTIKQKDDECLLTKNGYTSLKRKTGTRINDENSTRQLGSSKSNYNSNVNSVPSSYNGEDRAVRREALKETTNFLHSCKMEVSGKWRCPQKSKPDKGPPLKQLRLEKWVHRL
ncbi:hypothetical protein Cgig2_026884 [Carnegiea gigantea]|uniref:Uncharacterized protein n=1 Tax=Carnegiea gigantea TaxID=171969 RepID=A0A9Q1KXY2_9CARY|nr:hypothetical protein Cgig2_026884 [Carnegiea gigantea]